jgi:hypothetical protein
VNKEIEITNLTLFHNTTFLNDNFSFLMLMNKNIKWHNRIIDAKIQKTLLRCESTIHAKFVITFCYRLISFIFHLENPYLSNKSEIWTRVFHRITDPGEPLLWA